MPRAAALAFVRPVQAWRLWSFWREPSEPKGPAGMDLARKFDEAHEHLYGAAQFWPMQLDMADVDDYSSPSAKRAFRFTTSFRLEGRGRPAPYDLGDDDRDGC